MKMIIALVASLLLIAACSEDIEAQASVEYSNTEGIFLEYTRKFYLLSLLIRSKSVLILSFII